MPYFALLLPGYGKTAQSTKFRFTIWMIRCNLFKAKNVAWFSKPTHLEVLGQWVVMVTLKKVCSMLISSFANPFTSSILVQEVRSKHTMLMALLFYRKVITLRKPDKFKNQKTDENGTNNTNSQSML